MWVKFLIENHGERFYRDFLGIDPINGDSETESSFSLKKEKGRGRFDLVIKKEDRIVLVIENKFKSFPTNDQLQKYNKYFEEKSLLPLKVVISFNKDIARPLVPNNEDWKQKDYKDLVEFCKKLPKEDAIDKQIFREHYVKFLNEYTSDFDELITSNGFYKVIEQRRANTGFWTSLAYYIIASKIKEKISSDYTVTVFYGRQFAPGINIWKGEWGRFLLNGHGCWFEYQNNEFRLKFPNESIQDYDNLKKISSITNYRYLNHPSKNDKSFTLIAKALKSDDIEDLANNITREFECLMNHFKSLLTDKK